MTPAEKSKAYAAQLRYEQDVIALRRPRRWIYWPPIALDSIAFVCLCALAIWHRPILALWTLALAGRAAAQSIMSLKFAKKEAHLASMREGLAREAILTAYAEGYVDAVDQELERRLNREGHPPSLRN